MSVSVSIDWDDRVTPKLEALGIEVDSLKQEILTQAADMLLEKAKDTCPSPSSSMYPTESTGRLRDSHEIGEVTDTYAIIVVRAPYALYVHEGHYVVGGRFGTRIKGETAPAGIRSFEFVVARPWLMYAVDMVKPDLQVLLDQKVEQALQEADLS